jgi:Fe-S-cluster containining protein
MTSLEGALIYDYLVSNKNLVLLDRINESDHPSVVPRYTTNEFAQYCIEEKEVEENELWDLSPCLFLENNICTIYSVRPFGCRSFVSTKQCEKENAAAISPSTITVNSMTMQILEHLDQGNQWGNMVSLLKGIIGWAGFSENQPQGETDKQHLLISQANPGFLVPPEDREVAEEFLHALFSAKKGDKTLGQIVMA